MCYNNYNTYFIIVTHFRKIVDSSPYNYKDYETIQTQQFIGQRGIKFIGWRFHAELE
jgi:hypothetical protein